MPSTVTRPGRLRAALTVTATVIALGVAGVVGAPAAAAAPTPTAVPLKLAQQVVFDQQLIGYVNQARAAAGVPPVSVHAGLARTASYWSVGMSRGDTGGELMHNPDLRTMVLTSVKSSLLTWGENIAGFSADGYSARDIFTLYMESPGHRANILNPRYRYIGTVTVAGGGPTAFNTMDFAG